MQLFRKINNDTRTCVKPLLRDFLLKQFYLLLRNYITQTHSYIYIFIYRGMTVCIACLFT